MTLHFKKPQSLRSRPRHTTAALAVGVAAAVGCPVSAWAEGEGESFVLDTLKVEDRAIDSNPYAESGAPYKARRSADERYQKALADLPKNMAIITKTQIEDSGVTDLRELLDIQPGITLGTGENGNAFGDRVIIRGQEARSDVFVDGLRDPGMSIRESFATEQVEITKGPDSSFGGRGTAGGAINSVTKQASTAYDFTKMSVGVGSDNYHRLTLDMNKVLNDNWAVRANLLNAFQDVPDRSPADRRREGAALSVLFAPSSRFSVTTDWYHFKGQDRPDLGGYLVGDVALGNRRPADNPLRYAQTNDFLTSDVDTLTNRIRWILSDSVRVTNAFRYGQSSNDYVATGARQTVFGANSPNAGQSTVTLSSHNGWQDVNYLANQTNVFWDVLVGRIQHSLNFGLEYTHHKVRNGVYNTALAPSNCITGTATSNNAFCAINGSGQVIANLNGAYRLGSTRGAWDQDWSIETVSYSVMDTVNLSSTWTAFAGLRYDDYSYRLVTQNTAGVQNLYAFKDNIANAHAGLTWRFRDNAQAYLSFATAADINGGESDVGASSSYGGLAVTPDGRYSGKPEKTRSVELGTKWNLMDQKLLATAALFQITKTDVYESAITSPDDPNRYSNLGTLNTGESQTRGLELGLAGNVTPRLQVQGGVAIMNAEVLKSNSPTRVGKTLSNFADLSASAQMKYQLTPQIGLGTLVRYEGERYAGQPDTAPAFNSAGQYTQPLPAYTVTDLFATYMVDKKTHVRLNWGNVFDKAYYLAGYQSGAFLYKGDARNVRVTLNHEF